jgi:ADP-L-glycero-D-manno-heptose 6-epimerase
MLVVTGGTGFIGSALVWALNERGRDDILIVDDLGSDGKWKNLRGRKFLDIITPESLSVTLDMGAPVDGILHMGAITDTSQQDADALYYRNTVFTRHLAQWALSKGVRLIYASSASVYGDGAQGFSDADALTSELLPMNPYAFSKWLFDAEAIREGWLDTFVGLRFFNVFGPNEYHKSRMASVIWHATRQIQTTEKIELFQSHKEGYADGEQRRDFVYVKDVCDIALWFLDHPNIGGLYNVGTGQARTFNDLAAAIFAALGRDPNIAYVPTPESIRASYQYFTEADLSKLHAAGYDRPMTSLEDAVRDYVTQYLLNESNPYL